jgi:hypothetical protein
VTFICIDVANGYSQFFVEYVKKVRDKFPHHTIMVRCAPNMYRYSDRLIYRMDNFKRISLTVTDNKKGLAKEFKQVNGNVPFWGQ